MSLFSQFATDTSKEIGGVPVTYGPNEDGSVPTFFLRRQGRSNKAYTKAIEKETRPIRRQIELGTLTNEQGDPIIMGVFIKTILVGWENVQDVDGKEIQFSEENATDLFKKLPDLYEDLQSKAASAALFRDESLESEAKN